MVWGSIPVQAYKKDAGNRSLLIKIVADKAFAGQLSWENRARLLILDASDLVTEVLGIYIGIVDYEIWEHEATTDFGELTAKMINEVDRGRADILVGFVLLPDPGNVSEVRREGLSLAYRGFMVKTYQGGEKNNSYLPFIILHEMIHIYGGVHVSGNTLMTPVYQNQVVVELDPLNRGIVEITGGIDFKKGYSSLTGDQLARLSELYEQALKTDNQEIPTFLEMGAIYRERGLYEEAIDIFTQVVRRDQFSAYAWAELGDCYRLQGRADKAMETFEKAAQRTEDKGVFYLRLAILHFQAGEYRKSYDQAVLALHHGVRIDPTLIEGLRQHGLTLE